MDFTSRNEEQLGQTGFYMYLRGIRRSANSLTITTSLFSGLYVTLLNQTTDLFGLFFLRGEDPLRCKFEMSRGVFFPIPCSETKVNNNETKFN